MASCYRKPLPCGGGGQGKRMEGNMTEVTTTLAGFITALEGITSQDLSDSEITQRVEPLLADLLKSEDAVPEKFRVRPEGGRDTGYMLHRSARFNVVSIIWAPGETVKPHNHNTWGVIGVLRNVVEETRFQREEDSSIKKRSVLRHEAGSISVLQPGDEIHAMHNPTDRDTVEIHVYGKDLVGLPRTMWESEDRAAPLVSDKYLNC
jgi:predicted metal-dependent enzyme (double-stranded beta helix superfamily)